MSTENDKRVAQTVFPENIRNLYQQILSEGHILMSLLRPDELEKLRNYITVYLAKHNSSEIQ